MAKAKSSGFSVTFIMVSSLGGLAFLTVAALLWASFQIAEKNTVELIRDKAGLGLDSIEVQVNAQLSPVTTLMKDLAKMIAEGQVGDNSPEDLETVMRAAMAGTPQVSALVFVDKDQSSLTVRRDQPNGPAKRRHHIKDPEILKNFAQARTTEGPFWGQLYYVESVGATYLSAYARVQRGSEFLGVLLAGVSTIELSEFLTKLGHEDSARFINAFILYGRDHVLAHPMLTDGFPGLSDKYPLPSIDRFGDPVLVNFWRPEHHVPIDPEYKGNFDVLGMQLQDRGYVVIYRQLTGYGDVPWLIGSYFLADDIASQARRLGFLPWIAGAILVVALLLALILGRALARPTQRLAEAASKIENFDFKDVPALPHGMMLEMNRAADAFSSMVAGLKSFETYVPRGLVRELVAHHGDSGVQSEERELTVLFTDIADFTARVEHLGAAEVAAFLNEHFSLIGACVLAEGGTIDKYIGDALMAFWGAPQKQSDTAERACRAALAMRAIVEADNDRRAAAGKPRVGLRVGIHTGPVVVGNIGLAGRINYTVVGDTVNSCQRLESLGKEAGPADSGDVTILISAATKARIDPAFKTTPLGRFAVKGRDEELKVHALVDGPSSPPPSDVSKPA